MPRVVFCLAALAVALCFVAAPARADEDCGLAGHLCRNDTDCCSPLGCVLVQGGISGCGDAKLSISNMRGFAPPSPICPVNLPKVAQVKTEEVVEGEEGELKGNPLLPPMPPIPELSWCTWENNDCYDSGWPPRCPQPASAYLGECTMVGEYPAIARCNPTDGTATFHYYNATDCSCQWEVTHTKSWALNQCLAFPGGYSTEFSCINMESYSGSASSSSEGPPGRKKKATGDVQLA